MEKHFDYDGINLIPKMCIVKSRSECNTGVKLGRFTFNIPVVPANMQSVINEELCIKLASKGYFYIMHRFGVDNVKFVEYMRSLSLYTSISIGVNGDSYPTLEKLLKNNLIPDFITVDIAHGHAIKMKEMLKYLKTYFKESFIIAGNVSTAEGVMDLEKWGADAVKVGISPGCFTPNALVKTLKSNLSDSNFMEYEIKRLNDIEINDLVLTHKGRYREVKAIHKYENKNILIKINDLEPSTPTHEYYVINKYDKDFVTDKNIEDYAYWVQASELDKEKHLLVKM